MEFHKSQDICYLANYVTNITDVEPLTPYFSFTVYLCLFFLSTIVVLIAPCSQAPLCFCQIAHLVVSKPTEQHSACFSLFGIFWSDLAFFYKWFGIFCSLGPGKPLQSAQLGLCSHSRRQERWISVLLFEHFWSAYSLSAGDFYYTLCWSFGIYVAHCLALHPA